MTGPWPCQQEGSEDVKREFIDAATTAWVRVLLYRCLSHGA